MMKIALKNKRSTLLFLLSLLLLGCQQTKQTIKPELDYAVQDKYLLHLKPAQLPLTPEEQREPWGQEYRIGLAFAKKLDLYQAITSFKRADILMPDQEFARKAELQYQILNCYYLGKKYHEVIETFEESILANIDPSFPAFHDLLLILFESYLKCDNKESAEWIVHSMKRFYPDVADKLELTSAIMKADLFQMKKLAVRASTEAAIKELTAKTAPANGILLINNPSSFADIAPPSDEEVQKLERLTQYNDCQEATQKILSTYHTYKKSPALAGTLNAIFPGAGYLYLGQKQSAFTAACLNGLFIAAATHFYLKGNLPAAIITTGFESGWYFGGIVGAREAAVLYNERLFETHAHHHMRDNKLFPILMLQHGF